MHDLRAFSRARPPRESARHISIGRTVGPGPTVNVMKRLWQFISWGFLLSGSALGAKFTPLESHTNDTIFFSYAQSPDGK